MRHILFSTIYSLGVKKLEAILLEYAWVLVVLIVLEGLLAADNAVVMAVMVKHLPKNQQQKALLYGLVGAFFSGLLPYS